MFALFAISFLIFGYIFYYHWLGYTKGAPWVPMEADVVERVMKIAEVGSDDIFYDLGSGDGRLVIAASMHGARSYGIETDKLRVLYSRLWLWLLGLNKNAHIIQGDIFKKNISDATVVCTYLLPKTHQDLKKKLKKELKKGTKIVAVGFEYDNWKEIRVDPRGTIYGPIMLYKI